MRAINANSAPGRAVLAASTSLAKTLGGSSIAGGFTTGHSNMVRDIAKLASAASEAAMAKGATSTLPIANRPLPIAPYARAASRSFAASSITFCAMCEGTSS